MTKQEVKELISDINDKIRQIDSACRALSEEEDGAARNKEKIEAYQATEKKLIDMRKGFYSLVGSSSY